MAKKKHFTADEIMQYISWRISLARAEEDYETVNFFRRLGVSVIKTMYEDNRPLSPEILAEAGWKIDKETSFYSCLSKDLDEVYCNEDDFTAYMMIKFGKKRDYVRFDIERELGDSIRTNFKRNITVGEFNTLLDIVKLDKFKIK